jgi:hypothetical protein
VAVRRHRVAIKEAPSGRQGGTEWPPRRHLVAIREAPSAIREAPSGHQPTLRINGRSAKSGPPIERLSTCTRLSSA